MVNLKKFTTGPVVFSAGKLEVLGMFPPRTETSTAEKLALCYAPHVDMTTVIEVEVNNFLLFCHLFFLAKTPVRFLFVNGNIYIYMS